MRSPLLALSTIFFFLGVSLLTFEIFSLRSYIAPVSAEHEKVLSISSLEPTPTLSPIPTASPTPTYTPTPTISLQPSPTSVLVNSEQVDTNKNDSPSIQEYIMLEINNYRSSHGLSKVTTDSHTCNFARVRVEEVSVSFNHDGFKSRIDGNSLPYPTYSKVTENIAMNSDHTKVVESWINSSGHAENMRQDTPYVCVEQKGNYFVYVGWRP